MGRTLAKGIVAVGVPVRAGAAGERFGRSRPDRLAVQAGIGSNPCKPGMDTTPISPTGEVLGVDRLSAARKPKADCFYVYPTVSDDPTPNSDLSIDPGGALDRALPGGPLLASLPGVRADVPPADAVGDPLRRARRPPSRRSSPTSDVVSAWKTYLRKYNDGRGVILIGHSQGTYLLRQLVHDRVDRSRKGIRKRLISAILLGGNVTVPEGGNVGGDFQHVPGCREAAARPAAWSRSRPSTHRSRRTRASAGPATCSPTWPRDGDVLCTNPAALGGGSRAAAHRLSERAVRAGDHDRRRHRGDRRSRARR